MSLDGLFGWLAWGFPFIGAILSPLVGRIHPKLRDYVAVGFSFLAALSALLLFPSVLTGNVQDIQVPWITSLNISAGDST